MPDDPITLGRDVVTRLISSLHEGVFRATRGQVLGETLGMPVVLVTTTGARSGEPRSVMLTTPVSDDTSILLVASNGGRARHPGWFHNISAHPDVTVMRDGSERPMRARILKPAERKRMWTAVVKRYPGYAQYQSHTDREIQLVMLDAT